MKAYALAVAFIGACLCLGLFTFWRIHMVEDEGFKLLSHRTEEVTREWEMAKVPISRRILTFVLADWRYGSDLFKPTEEPGWLEKPLGKLSYAFLPRKISGNGWAPLGDVYTPSATTSARASTGTATLNWDYDGFLADDQERMAKAIADALKLVQAAQGQSNVVAQGMAAIAAIDAIKSIAELQPRDGRPMVKTLVRVGRDLARSLRGFDRRANLYQMVSVSCLSDPFSGQFQNQWRIDLDTPKSHFEPSPSYFVAPRAPGKSGADSQALAGVVKEIIERPEDAEQVLSEKEKAAKEKGAVWKNHDGFYFTKGAPPAAAPAYSAPVQPAADPSRAPQSSQDSLSSVTGGSDYAVPEVQGGSPPGGLRPRVFAERAASQTGAVPRTEATYVPTSAPGPSAPKDSLSFVRGGSDYAVPAAQGNTGFIKNAHPAAASSELGPKFKSERPMLHWRGADPYKYSTEAECLKHNDWCVKYGQ